jgi:hypothetical protein
MLYLSGAALAGVEVIFPYIQGRKLVPMNILRAHDKANSND